MSSLKDHVPAAIPSQSLQDALFGQLLAPIFGQKEALSNILNVTNSIPLRKMTCPWHLYITIWYHSLTKNIFQLFQLCWLYLTMKVPCLNLSYLISIQGGDCKHIRNILHWPFTYKCIFNHIQWMKDWV